MSDKYIIDEEGEYVIDTETNDMWDATGGGDGIYMLVKKVNKLLEENDLLKMENYGLQDGLDFYREHNERIKKIEKENEQLKEELESFEQVYFTDMYDGSSKIFYMRKENGDSE